MTIQFNSKPGGFKPKVNPLSEEIERKKAAAEAKQEQETRLQLEAETKEVQDINISLDKRDKLQFAPADQVKDRIKIIFDDSSSMSYQKMDDAIQGCIEFMRNCGFNQTAIAICPLNSKLFEFGVLTTNLPDLAAKVKMLKAKGGTRLYTTWMKTLAKNITRYVIFSDGQPTDYDGGHAKEIDLTFCIENKIPCDTILIWDSPYAQPEGSREYAELKEIADKTGGVFMVFDRKKVNFKTAFKYLAPTYRLALAASVDMQKDLQEGKLI